MSRTIETVHAKRGQSDHNILIQGGTAVVDMNRSQQMLVQQAYDGSMGASGDSADGAHNRNGGSQHELYPRNEVFNSNDPALSNADALNRPVKPVLLTDMEKTIPSQVEEENKILEIQDLAINNKQASMGSKNGKTTKVIIANHIEKEEPLFSKLGARLESRNQAQQQMHNKVD